MRNRSTIRSALVGLIATLFIGGIAHSQGEPVYGGTLSIAYTSTSPHIDIQGTNQGSLSESAHYMYETLFDRDADGNIVPLLATGYEVSADGLTYTFSLQPGVTFHDGTPFNAEAVKYNLERKINLQLPTWNTIPWSQIIVADPLTLRVELTNPAPHILPVLSAKTWSMYSPTHAEAVGPDGVRIQGVGTGPFMQQEFRPNEVRSNIPTSSSSPSARGRFGSKSSPRTSTRHQTFRNTFRGPPRMRGLLPSGNRLSARSGMSTSVNHDQTSVLAASIGLI